MVVSGMTLETELKEIKEKLLELNEKLDALLEERETQVAMGLSEKSLNEFLEGEPDLYTEKDLKANYS